MTEVSRKGAKTQESVKNNFAAFAPLRETFLE